MTMRAPGAVGSILGTRDRARGDVSPDFPLTVFDEIALDPSIRPVPRAWHELVTVGYANSKVEGSGCR